VSAADDSAGWVQGQLLGMGLARAYTLAAHRACAAELLAAERSAREARLGLWAEAAYKARQADPSATLLRHVGTFQLVEGRVVRVATTRSSIYINFGTQRRRGFSVSLKLSDRAQLGKFSDNPKGLEQALVRVRGWIEQRSGEPSIDLSTAGDIEVTAEGVASETAERRTERRSRTK
jgi:micrococcal nuclease